MKNILVRLLKKRGIESVDELDKDEKKDLEQWQRTLSKEELTIDDVKDFCQSQLGVIEGKWADYNLEREKKNNLIPYHAVYKMLLNVIESPRSTREALEKNLQQMLEQ